MRTSSRRYYSTTAGLRQASNISPTSPVPLSHNVHFNTPKNMTDGNVLHEMEDPVISLDYCVRGITEKPRPVSLSSNDTGDEMFTPKHKLTGTVDIVGPPPSSHHRSQMNSSMEKDRGRVKKSKVAINNGTDEVRKKKRHSHQPAVPTGQVPREPAKFVGNDISEMVSLKLRSQLILYFMLNHM